MAGQMTRIFPRIKRDRRLLVIFTEQPPLRDKFSPSDTLYMVVNELHPLIAGEPPCELTIVAEEPRDGNILLHVSCYVMGHPIFIFSKDLLLPSHILLCIFQY
jgi:hypothetical protein